MQKAGLRHLLVMLLTKIHRNDHNQLELLGVLVKQQQQQQQLQSATQTV